MRWETEIPDAECYPYTPEGVEQFYHDFDSFSGAYFIQLAENKIFYPGGYSPLIYIGRGVDILRRLDDHPDEKDNNWALRNYIRNRPCEFATFPHDDPVGIETDALGHFYLEHGSLPICNNIYSDNLRDYIVELNELAERRNRR